MGARLMFLHPDPEGDGQKGWRPVCGEGARGKLYYNNGEEWLPVCGQSSVWVPPTDPFLSVAAGSIFTIANDDWTDNAMPVPPNEWPALKTYPLRTSQGGLVTVLGNSGSNEDFSNAFARWRAQSSSDLGTINTSLDYSQYGWPKYLDPTLSDGRESVSYPSLDGQDMLTLQGYFVDPDYPTFVVLHQVTGGDGEFYKAAGSWDKGRAEYMNGLADIPDTPVDPQYRAWYPTIDVSTVGFQIIAGWAKRVTTASSCSITSDWGSNLLDGLFDDTKNYIPFVFRRWGDVTWDNGGVDPRCEITLTGTDVYRWEGWWTVLMEGFGTPGHYEDGPVTDPIRYNSKDPDNPWPLLCCGGGDPQVG